MQKIVHMKIFKGETYFVAEGLEFPIVTQGKTPEELDSNIREAVALYLENEDFEVVRV
jgi:predicted RNase H-like HicB family nuclease